MLSLLLVAAAALPGELIPPEEPAAIQDILANVEKGYELRAKSAPHVGRMAHAKHHGCVHATFAVAANVPKDLRSGVFAKAASYPAWIRFSNGNSHEQPDSVPDTRGFALKLIGVEGPKLLPGELHTQDFLMHSHPAFMVRDVAGFAKYMRLAADTSVSALLRAADELHKEKPAEAVHELVLGAKLVSAPIWSPLQQRYWSALPAALGKLAVKLSVRPCKVMKPALHNELARLRPDHLRDQLKQELSKGDGCLELLVQRQAAGMPVEDPTALWDERKSPFVKVATINIPKQAFDSPAQMQFCQDLSFSSWHSLADHRPLGGINRLRKAAYEFSSKRRHGINGAAIAEPTGAERF